MAFQDFQGAGYIKLRGLPYSAGTKEVSEFLAEFGIMEENIVIGMNAQQRPSGEAWVQFLDVASAEEAKRQKDRQRIGGRYIEIFSSTFEAACAGSRGGGGAPIMQQVPSLPDFPGSAYLRLRGLPYTATQADVAEFFAEYGVEPSQVIMGSEGATGRASGEAWVQLASEDLAAQARAAKDRQTIGTRWIEVFPSTAAEAANANSRPTQDRSLRGGIPAVGATGSIGGKGAAAAALEGIAKAVSAGEVDWNWYAATMGWYAAAAQNAVTAAKGGAGAGGDRYSPY
mmetsp:Transcript_42926/g.80095  ORF Transcript_42926/g.80095 Transcript_42926/m.80095 type:complete len:285 (-) Transcript_42926:48-902(-)